MNLRRYTAVGATFAWPLNGGILLQEARDRHVVTGNPVVEHCQWGNALGMNEGGTNDYITLGGSWEDQLRFDAGTLDFSIASWIRSTKEGFEEIIDKRDGLNDGWELSVQASGVPLFRLNALTCTGPAGSVFDDLWHSIIVTVDRSADMYVYVDGAPGGADAVGGAVMATTATPRIGCCSYAALTNLFEGAVAGIVIFPRVLSAAECAGMASGGGPF